MTIIELAETCAHVAKAIGVDPWRVRATVTAGEEGPVVILELVELAISPDPEVLAGVPARWSTQAEREDLHVRAAHHFRRVLEQERAPELPPSPPNIFVDPLHGDDANDGTRAAPLRSIRAAIGAPHGTQIVVISASMADVRAARHRWERTP